MTSPDQTAMKYFLEYQNHCREDPKIMMQDLQKWESGDKIIHELDRKGQAEYADYVIQKMCALCTVDDLSEFAKSAVGVLSKLTTRARSCQIGNMAAIILALPSGELKKKLELELTTYLAKYK